MMVTEGWDAQAPAPNPCPNCGESGFGLDWPPEPSRLLLRQAFLREPSDQEEAAVQALLVAAALDVTLEWILAAGAEYLSSESTEIAHLVDRVRETDLSTEQRLDMLEDMTDIDLREVAGFRDEPDFPARWRDLRERRDLFLHEQQQFAFDGLAQADLAETARAAVKVMAHVNNLVW